MRGRFRSPRIAGIVGVALTTMSRLAASQSAVVSLRGVAYDSVRNGPLAAALVVIAGTDRSAVTDDRGRFRFDSVAPGMYRLEMQHAVLDTMGLSGISRSVRV